MRLTAAAVAVALVASSCGAGEGDRGVDAASGLPVLEDFPAGWEVLDEVRQDDHPYDQVVADCAGGDESVEDIAGVDTAYGLRSSTGSVSPSAYPVTVVFPTESVAAEAVVRLTGPQFTDCLDGAALSDPNDDSAPYFPGTFTYVKAEIADRLELETRGGAVDDAVYLAVEFEVEPLPDGPQASVLAYGFYVLRRGPLVQVTRMAPETDEDADDILDAVFAPFESASAESAGSSGLQVHETRADDGNRTRILSLGS